MKTKQIKCWAQWQCCISPEPSALETPWEILTPCGIPGKGFLQRTNLPQETRVRPRGADDPLVYLQGGQPEALQIPILCSNKDQLTCLSPPSITRYPLTWLDQTSVKFLPASVTPATWVSTQLSGKAPVSRAQPRGNTFTGSLSHHSTHSSHFPTPFRPCSHFPMKEKPFAVWPQPLRELTLRGSLLSQEPLSLLFP